MTQYELERACAAWRRDGADPARAGATGDWVLELDGLRLLLHPLAQRWFYFDAVHAEWLDTGIAGGEAVFVSIGGVLGARRALAADELALPLEERIERVARRLVAAVDGELVGPMAQSQLLALAAERPAASFHVWSTRAPRWTPL